MGFEPGPQNEWRRKENGNKSAAALTEDRFPRTTDGGCEDDRVLHDVVTRGFEKLREQ